MEPSLNLFFGFEPDKKKNFFAILRLKKQCFLFFFIKNYSSHASSLT